MTRKRFQKSADWNGTQIRTSSMELTVDVRSANGDTSIVMSPGLGEDRLEDYAIPNLISHEF